MIATPYKQHYITAGAISPGGSNIQSAYCSEILGLFSISEALHNLCKDRNIIQGGCAIFCDGLSVLQVVDRVTREFIHARYTACNLLTAYIGLKENIPIELNFSHIKGHQDEQTEIHQLSTPSQLNILMDGFAKDLLRHISSKHDQHALPNHIKSLPLPKINTLICQYFKTQLYDEVMNEKGNQYWVEKQRYD